MKKEKVNNTEKSDFLVDRDRDLCLRGARRELENHFRIASLARDEEKFCFANILSLRAYIITLASRKLTRSEPRPADRPPNIDLSMLSR